MKEGLRKGQAMRYTATERDAFWVKFTQVEGRDEEATVLKMLSWYL